jgi:hypothetical protein
MFGMRASTPSYGRAFALSNVPNLVPAMSGSINTASVHNTSGDLVTNDIPSTFLIPSLHPDLNKNNEFNEGDFVFALNPRYHTFACGQDYAMDYKSAFNGTATIVTLPKLNELLQEYTKKAVDENLSENLWFTDPVLVREWARPLGVVLNKMRVNAGRNANGKTAHYGLNISVSRRANVKNNFMGMSEHGRDWFGQSTMKVAVQYSKELINKKNVSDGETTDLVVVSMILVDSNLKRYEHRDTKLTISEGDRQSEEAVRQFGENPMGTKGNNVVTTIGRVLNSSMRSPTSFMALTSCYSKKDYDNLPPIEIELGCA